MKLSFLINTGCLFLFFGHSVNAANCNLLIAYGPLGSNTQTVTVEAGQTQAVNIDDMKYVFNGGVNSARIRVKGFATPSAWYRLNQAERYDGLVALESIRCLAVAEPPRNALEQISDRARVDADVLGRTAQETVDRIRRNAERVVESLEDLGQNWYDAVNTEQWLSVGRAGLCDTFLGNQDNQRIQQRNALQFRGARGNRNKFDNLQITTDFSVMNNYLLMQAANKTYYHQLKYGVNQQNQRWEKAQSEREFRCAAQELYRYWGFDDVWFVNGNLGANAIVGIAQDKAVIAIRGTQNPGEFAKVFDFASSQGGPLNIPQLVAESMKGNVDVLTNISHFKVPAAPLGIGNAGEVHGGYAMAALEINLLIDLMEPIVQLRQRPIFITGHSLGGATATLLAKRMQQQNYDVQAAYVYAPPKVGDRRFMTDLRNQLNLFVTWNYRDPVPTFMNSQWAKLGDLSLTGIDQFRFTWEGAKRFVFFNQQHDALLFEPAVQAPRDIYLRIREEQGAPYPEVLLRNGLMSEEWFFHNGNFYTAFTYNEVLKVGLLPVNNSAIEPEFIKEPMCLFWSDSFTPQSYDWNANYRRFVSDKQAYPLQHCLW